MLMQTAFEHIVGKGNDTQTNNKYEKYSYSSSYYDNVDISHTNYYTAPCFDNGNKGTFNI